MVDQEGGKKVDRLLCCKSSQVDEASSLSASLSEYRRRCSSSIRSASRIGQASAGIVGIQKLVLELALDDQMLSQALRVLLDDIYNSVVYS